MRWLSVWGCGLLLACAAPQESKEVQLALEELRAASRKPPETGDKVQDVFNEQAWSNTWYAYATYFPHLQNRSRRLEPIPGEQKLERLGREAVPAILQFLQEPNHDPVIVARLLELAGRFGDGAVAPFIERSLHAERPPMVRRAAVRALGYLKAPDLGPLVARAEKAKGTSPHAGLWIRCMQGDEAARAEYFHSLETALRQHLVDEIRPGPQIRPPDEQELREPARQDREQVQEDLISLADVSNPRALVLLVECFRHTDPDIPHLAHDLLKRRIAPTARPPFADAKEFLCASLHDGTKYQAWKNWLDKEGPRLKWSPALRQWDVPAK